MRHHPTVWQGVRPAWRLALAAVPVLALLAGGPALAQLPTVHAGPTAPASGDEPVTFTADQVTYDRDAGIVTASGHVEAWQNGHTLYADRVMFDQKTNVAAAEGHVVLLEPDGQTLFSSYAELTEGMRNAVLKGMHALLAQNGRMAANGARRTTDPAFAGQPGGGEINQMSRAVYTTCNACKEDPAAAPAWQIRSLSAVQNPENHRIEYQDAWLDVYGVPLLYFPYFYSADPSVRRESGFLTPSIGESTYTGSFVSIPYYWVLDDESDVTLTGTQTVNAGPQLLADYRRVFNDGQITVNASAANEYHAAQGHIFSHAIFDFDDTWRYGFDINRATSQNYLRDFRVVGGGVPFLTTDAYVEGFGEGVFQRLDTRVFQGLTAQVDANALPIALPNYQYNFVSDRDDLGGRLSLTTKDWKITRSAGTNDTRGALSAQYDLPFQGDLGDLYKLTFRGDAAAYTASDLNLTPNFSRIANSDIGRALPQAALEWRWPLARDGSLFGGPAGRQLVEPIVQLIGAPNTGSGSNYRIPNEDSLDLQFTDQNLFSFNRFSGFDRLEGGVRANVGLHTAMTTDTGVTYDGLIGQVYRPHNDDTFPIGSGLNSRVSDVVARATVIPTSWLNFTLRGRFDHDDLAPRYGEAVAGAGTPLLSVSGGYIYDTTNPFNLYSSTANGAASLNNIISYNTTTGAPMPRNEASFAVSSRIGQTTEGQYRFSAFAVRDLTTNTMVNAGGRLTYEDECTILDLSFYRRYTSLNGDNGSQTFQIQITLKTIGQFGYHAD